MITIGDILYAIFGLIITVIVGIIASIGGAYGAIHLADKLYEIFIDD